MYACLNNKSVKKILFLNAGQNLNRIKKQRLNKIQLSEKEKKMKKVTHNHRLSFKVDGLYTESLVSCKEMGR